MNFFFAYFFSSWKSRVAKQMLDAFDIVSNNVRLLTGIAGRQVFWKKVISGSAGLFSQHFLLSTPVDGRQAKVSVFGALRVSSCCCSAFRYDGWHLPFAQQLFFLSSLNKVWHAVGIRIGVLTAQRQHDFVDNKLELGFTWRQKIWNTRARTKNSAIESPNDESKASGVFQFFSSFCYTIWIHGNGDDIQHDTTNWKKGILMDPKTTSW